MIKVMNKLGLEGIYLNIINAVFDKSLAFPILSGEKLKPFLLKSEMKQSVYFPHSYSLSCLSSWPEEKDKGKT
jgi:hypothetical protein